MPPSILVTGATGTVGADVATQFHRAGCAVRAATRHPERARAHLGSDLDHVRFDFEEPATFAAAFRGVDRLFLMRPPTMSRGRALHPAIDAARDAGVQHVVFLSVLGAGENPLLPHRTVEKALHASGLAYTFLRPADFMQNLATVHQEAIRERSEIFLPAGQGRTAFIDARDVASVAAAALTEPGHEGRAYDLTGGQALSFYDVAALLSDVLNRRITYCNPSLPRFVFEELRRGRPLGFVLVMTGIYTVMRLGWANRVTSATERVLGCPPTSMRTYAEDHKAQWL